MSDIVRLTLVSHAMTDAMSAGRFPIDEPLSDLGRRQAGATTGFGPVDRALCGPEARTRGTADLLGLDADVDPLLRDLDAGEWRGRTPDRLDPAVLAQWLTDPQAAPHGGESVADLLERVRCWLDGIAGAPARIVAVTHPAVVRAAVLVALQAPPKSFWRIDVEPMSRIGLHRRGPGWTLRLGH